MTNESESLCWRQTTPRPDQNRQLQCVENVHFVLGWMCCTIWTINISNCIFSILKIKLPYTVHRHQGYTRVIIIIDSIIKIITIFINILSIIIIYKMMMTISRWFSYGGFSDSYMLRSYFGCMPLWWCTGVDRRVWWWDWASEGQYWIRFCGLLLTAARRSV